MTESHFGRHNLFGIDSASKSAAAHDCESGRSYSYRQLGSDIRRIADVLSTGSKALIACFCRNDYETMCGYLACLAARQAVMLLDSESARQRQLIDVYQPEFILESSRAAHEGYDHYELFDSAGPNLWRRQDRAEGPEINGDLALMLTTSGSTGTAKFVRLSYSNIFANADAIRRDLAIQDRDCAVTSLPFNYSYGLSVIHSHLLAGASVALTAESLTSRCFWNACRDFKCSSFAGVPYSYQLLCRLGLPNEDLPDLHTMTQAGGHLPANLVEHNYRLMASRKGRFFVMYGQTEATARICILPPDYLPEKLGSAGRVISGGEISTDQGGIVYRGPNVMLGYAEKRSDLSRGDELHGLLRTGDQGHIDGDGFVYITGRLNRFAKISGIRVNLDEVEAILKPHGPAAVISFGEKLVIFCEAPQNELFFERREALAQELSLHRQFLDVRSLPTLPLKANGKIDYLLLEESVSRC